MRLHTEYPVVTEDSYEALERVTYWAVCTATVPVPPAIKTFDAITASASTCRTPCNVTPSLHAEQHHLLLAEFAMHGTEPPMKEDYSR